MKKGKSIILTKMFIALFIIASICMNTNSFITHAESVDMVIVGKVYELDKKNDYEFTSADIFVTTDAGAATYGTFSLAGEVEEINRLGADVVYRVSNQNLTFSYSYEDKLLNGSEDSWHLISDNGKKIDAIKLESEVGKGAIVLQTSKDGLNWMNAYIETDAFVDESEQDGSFYTATEVQLLNGCYYRLIVVYELAIRTEDKKILPDTYDYKRVVEVYEFYAYDSSIDGETLEATNQYRLGSKVKSDKSYSRKNEIGINDDHYGWDLGNFYVSGWTSYTEDKNNIPVFLKNVGDEVTLWFNLVQNIDCLNGNSQLSINNNEEGYDEYFEIPKTEFGRGTLIIRYTDHENITHDPIIYTNYLEANATLGADTRVQLFEEGDYEVALDYEIVNDKLLDQYSHYRIYFKFSVRNSNCMVYPFDVKTGSELTNTSITPNGFYLDLARSRYLKINIKKEVLKEGADGLTEDVRFNQAASDGDRYLDEGIYTITVKNEYTNEETVKKIYVGTNDVLKAYTVTGLSIEEIEDLVSMGAVIEDDGTITLKESSTIAMESQPDVSEPEKAEVSVEESSKVNVRENNGEGWLLKGIASGFVVIVLAVGIAVVLYWKKIKGERK